MAQERSENTYQKINTIFKRDEFNIIMPYAEFAMPELEWLRNCKFDATEKIDGTNIRIELDLVIDETGTPKFVVSYKGKTDRAKVPALLLEHLQTKFPLETVVNALNLGGPLDESWLEFHKFTSFKDVPKYTIYGEGYGVKIQDCGKRYLSKENSFIVFDVKVGQMYLLRKSVEDIANKLNAPVVPYMGQFTIDEAIEFVRKGFKSSISEDKEFMAEGLILTTPAGLRNRRGERIIFKIKHNDFNKYRVKYGTDLKVEQKEKEIIL